jgi:predicted component of type VI protein secretion system
MPPQLLALTDGPNILLDKPILLLGRHQECDIQLGSRKVSRRHCCLAQVDDYLVVRDLGSTNGIRINGIRVVEGSLRAGDELTIGNQRYQLQWPGKAGDPLLSSQPPAARHKLQPGPDEDAKLEACDDPVPLAEPGLPLQAGPVLSGVPVGAAPPGGPDPKNAGQAPRSAIVPEDLKLEPASGDQAGKKR